MISDLFGCDRNDDSPLLLVQFVMIFELLLEDGEIGV
jgi:hypothetical protein